MMYWIAQREHEVETSYGKPRRNSQILEVHSTGVEPVTIDLGGCCSIQLGVSIVAAAHHELMRLREQEIELL